MEDLCKVMDMLNLSEQHARTLLIYHRWDVERLFAGLVDKERDQLFAEAGVTIVEHKDPIVAQQFTLVTCNVCIEDMSPDEVTTMDCGHCFCNTCKHIMLPLIFTKSKKGSYMLYLLL